MVAENRPENKDFFALKLNFIVFYHNTSMTIKKRRPNMARNCYYEDTCIYHYEGWCKKHGTDYNCGSCSDYVSNGDYADEEEYEDCMAEQEYYTSNRWLNDNPDSNDIGDYYYDHS